MRRISTLFLYLASIVFTTNHINAQTCTVLTTNGSNQTCPTNFSFSQDFNSLVAPNMGGFSGTNWSLQGNQNKFLEYGGAVTQGNPATLLTPTFVYTASNIYVKFDLGGNNLTNLTSIDFGYITSTQPLVQPLCSVTLTSNQVPGTLCLALPNPVPGQRIRLVITLNGNVNGANKPSIDNFFTNGVEAIGLPVNFINFQSKRVSNGLQLTWTVANEERLNRYELERSTDARNYTAVGSLTASGQSSYSLTDLTPSSGTVYYRVKSIDDNGTYRYSSVLRLDNGKSAIVLRAFPLPAANSITLQHEAAAQGAKITISAEDGRIVKTIMPTISAMQTSIDIANLRAGMYLVRFDNSTSTVETIKIVKQ